MTVFQKINLKFTTAFWVDKHFNKLKAKDINDDYLKHIVYFIAEGYGWNSFINNKRRINKIFKETYKRNILRSDVVLLLHSWTLYHHGYLDKAPKYFPTWEGKYKIIN